MQYFALKCVTVKSMWGRVIPLVGVTDVQHLLNRLKDTCTLTHRSANIMIVMALPEGRASGNHRQKSCHHIVI